MPDNGNKGIITSPSEIHNELAPKKKTEDVQIANYRTRILKK